MLPINLPNGIVAVYGMGTSVSTTGIGNIDPSGDLRFGQVYQVYEGGAVFVYNFDNIMFREGDVTQRIMFDNIPYTLVPARLVTKESPLL